MIVEVLYAAYLYECWIDLYYIYLQAVSVDRIKKTPFHPALRPDMASVLPYHGVFRMLFKQFCMARLATQACRPVVRHKSHPGRIPQTLETT